MRLRSSAQFAALLIGCTGDVYASVVTALGVAARRVLEADPRSGAEQALVEEFDVILCAARVAFGQFGFLETLHREDPRLTSRVILVAPPGERDLVIARLEETGRYNTCLFTPVEPAIVLEIARTGFVVLPWSIPIPRARGTPPATGTPTTSSARVLLIDDSPEAQSLASASPPGTFTIDVTDDPWTALDYLEGDPHDLILCSASLRAGTTPVYRLLWNAHPELKPRFLLVASPSQLRDVGAASRSRTLVERPLTAERIAEALQRVASPRPEPS